MVLQWQNHTRQPFGGQIGQMRPPPLLWDSDGKENQTSACGMPAKIFINITGEDSVKYVEDGYKYEDTKA